MQCYRTKSVCSVISKAKRTNSTIPIFLAIYYCKPSNVKIILNVSFDIRI